MPTDEQHDARCERLAKATEDAQLAFWEELQSGLITLVGWQPPIG